jgi:hypothetical protein
VRLFFFFSSGERQQLLVPREKGQIRGDAVMPS